MRDDECPRASETSPALSAALAAPPGRCQICGAAQEAADSILCRVCGEPVLRGGWA